jgi:RNA 2',3'-cyclic 3'-phosphodiesterase
MSGREAGLKDLPEKIRAFVALDVSPETAAALAAFIEDMRALADRFGWVRSANFHITLRFLGNDVDSRKLEPLCKALDAIARETPPFAITARATGAFPGLARPRVIWVRLESAALVPLAKRVETAAVECGFEPERRAYSPHLTIGRVRNFRGWRAARRAIEEAATREFGVSRIEKVTLYRSILGPGGAAYEVLAAFPLTG